MNVLRYAIVCLIISVAGVVPAAAKQATINGVPQSFNILTVEVAEDQFVRIVSIVVLEGNEKFIAEFKYSKQKLQTLSHLIAMLRAEINDGDDDTIEIGSIEQVLTHSLDGTYPNDVYKVDSIEIDGYKWKQQHFR